MADQQDRPDEKPDAAEPAAENAPSAPGPDAGPPATEPPAPPAKKPPAKAAKAIQISADANTLGAYIANSVYTGRAAEARQAAGRLLKLQPDFRASHGRDSLPSRSPEVRERIVAAFRTAGLPD